jgi:hypothetical protein
MWICVKEKNTDATESQSRLRRVQIRVSSEAFKKFGRSPREWAYRLFRQADARWNNRVLRRLLI